ncbi:MAG: insulinase family protein [Planctomycetes bacterium]|nr:insulinase family protein [Planctomycetota bacterium]
MSDAPPRPSPLFERIDLPNGIPLFVRPSRRFKTVVIKLHLHHALGDDATETALVPFVLRRGCRRQPSFRRIVQFLEGLYGASLSVDVLKLGERQILSFRLDVLGDRYLPRRERNVARALAFLERLVAHPVRAHGAFPAVAVAREQENLRRIIASLYDDKAEYAAQRCREVMCAEEPFRLYEYGRLERIAAITPAGLAAHHRRLLAEAPLDLYVSGDVNPARLARAAGEVFDFKRRATATLPATSPDRPVERERTVIEESDVEQGKLVMGYRTYTPAAHPDYYPLLFLNGLLGGFAHSRLFRVFREQEGLAYSAGSALERTKGLLEVEAGIAPADFERAAASVRRQVEELAAGRIDDQEMAWSLSAFEDAIRGMPDSPAGEIAVHVEQRLAGREESYEESLARARAVTKEEVARAAGRLRLDTVYFLRPRGGGRGSTRG